MFRSAWTSASSEAARVFQRHRRGAQDAAGDREGDIAPARRKTAGRRDFRRESRGLRRIDIAADASALAMKAVKASGLTPRHRQRSQRCRARAGQCRNQSAHRFAAGRQRGREIAGALDAGSASTVAEIGARQLHLPRKQRGAVIVLQLEQAGRRAAVEFRLRDRKRESRPRRAAATGWRHRPAQTRRPKAWLP